MDSLHPSCSNSLVRSWHSSNCVLKKSQFVYPVFISYKDDDFSEITSLPGQYRIGVNRLIGFLQPLVDRGLSSVILFGCIGSELKDSTGSYATHADSPIVKAITSLKATFDNLIVICDVCLCSYTSHGHCGILDSKGNIDLDLTNGRLAEISGTYATLKCDIIAPSSMTDGRVAAIKKELVRLGLSSSTSIMSYSAKYASCLYGPFRDAAGSAPATGDRKKYQLPYGSSGLGIRGAIRDVEEGADIVMVKPGLPYLDVLKSIGNALPNHVLAVYHVSGEYSMLMKAAECGIVNLREAALEIMTSFRRAGASIIITYLTPYILSIDLDS